jgi:hypothetical protein
MKTLARSLTLALLLAAVTATAGFAAGGPPEKTDGFVCPVFNEGSAAGAHNPNAVQIGGGDFTIIGPNVSVPIHATNGDGDGTPPGPHSVPGDTDYTAVWAGQ